MQSHTSETLNLPRHSRDRSDYIPQMLKSTPSKPLRTKGNSKTPRTAINKKWCELADEKKMIAQKKLENLNSEAIRQQEIHSLKVKQMIEKHELTMKNLKEEHLIKLKIMLDSTY
jgi:hypothetical protein